MGMKNHEVVPLELALKISRGRRSSSSFLRLFKDQLVPNGLLAFDKDVRHCTLFFLMMFMILFENYIFIAIMLNILFFLILSILKVTEVIYYYFRFSGLSSYKSWLRLFSITPTF